MADKPSYEELEQQVQKLEFDALECKQAKELLRRSEIKYRLLAESATDVICVINLDRFALSYASPSVESVFGYTFEELMNLNIYDFLTPDSANRVMGILDQEVEKNKFGKAEPQRLEVEVLCKDGLTVWAEVSARFLRDDNNQIESILCVLRDVSERKKLEEELLENKKRFQSLYNNAPDMYFTVSPDGIIISVNQFGADYLGYSVDELVGNFVWKIVYKDDLKKIQSQMAEIFNQKLQKSELEFRKIRKDGSILWVHERIRLILDENDTPIELWIICRDITSRKKVETEKAQLESQLRQAQKMESIGTLAGGIAHDFNNILGAIIGNIELAIDDVPEGNHAHYSLDQIKKAVIRATNIVRQLLTFTCNTSIKLQPIAFTPVCKDAIKFLRSTIPTTIDIRTNFQAEDDTVLADPTQIHQTLMNLCSNAAQAMTQKGGAITIRVENETLDDASGTFPELSMGEYVKLTVADTGPGIDEQNIDRIFDPYFTTKEVGKGTGMGLSVVHGIVKSNNGSISVDSQLGKGTTFTILLPLVFEKPEQKTKIMEDIPTGKESILLVDDEESLLVVGREVLERLGYTVESTLSPIEALQKFSSNPDHFDLIITDMTMPQMTGAALSKKIKEIRNNIPVVLCTGYSDLIYEDNAEEMGLNAYIMKPIRMKEIAKTIRTVLDKK